MWRFLVQHMPKAPGGMVGFAYRRRVNFSTGTFNTTTRKVYPSVANQPNFYSLHRFCGAQGREFGLPPHDAPVPRTAVPWRRWLHALPALSS
jgi:hypothetical protein